MSAADFKKLTQFPVVPYYGDYIKVGSDNVGEDKWAELAMARQFVDTVNKHGGKAELVHLPKVGIKGNTHFLFSDLNNAQVAGHIASWLHRKGLGQ